jgi:hypothetical protein
METASWQCIQTYGYLQYSRVPNVLSLRGFGAVPLKIDPETRMHKCNMHKIANGWPLDCY